MPLRYELVTPERALAEGEAYMVELPASEGDMGVLEGHAPVMTTVRDGELRVWSDDRTVARRFEIEGGFAEVNERGLTVLAERATALD